MRLFKIKIQNEKFGLLLDETIVDPIQFKLFIKSIHACLELKDDLSFFNGDDFLIHIPYKILNESVIITSYDKDNDLAQRMKSKVEALVTKQSE